MNKPICKTHPWIDFTINLKKLDNSDWFILGRAAAMVDVLAHMPMNPDLVGKLHRMYLIKGTKATTAIEGNTLSEKQISEIMDGKLKLPESRRYLQTEVENMLQTANSVIEQGQAGTLEATPTFDDLLGGNQTVLHGLELPEEVIPGAIRMHRVGVSRYAAPPPDVCEELLRYTCHWIARWRKDHADLPHVILQAVITHLYIAWIHPFGDGNGRTARLSELHILFTGGVPMPAAQLSSNHYNLTRSEYYRRLDEASKSCDPTPFIRYAIRGFADQIEEQLKEVRQSIRTITFRDFVYDTFRDNKAETSHRRRALVLDLAEHGATPKDEIPLLTPRLATLYRNKTSKTVTRDLHELLAMGLIVGSGRKWQANIALVDALRPRRHRE